MRNMGILAAMAAAALAASQQAGHESIELDPFAIHTGRAAARRRSVAANTRVEEAAPQPTPHSGRREAKRAAKRLAFKDEHGYWP